MCGCGCKRALAPGMPGGDPQVWYGDGPQVLATTHGEEGLGGTVRFRVYTPDSRLRVKISLIFTRDDPASDDPITAAVFGIYLGAEENDRSGSGQGPILVTDILRDAAGNVVHQSGPLTIPEDAGLQGFSYEFVTSADSVLGIFTIAETAVQGKWVLQCRWQPDGQRLADDDWEWVKRGCHATTLTPAVVM